VPILNASIPSPVSLWHKRDTKSEERTPPCRDSSRLFRRLPAPHRSHPDLDRGRASPRLQRANPPGPAWLLQPLSLVARARGPIPPRRWTASLPTVSGAISPTVGKLAPRGVSAVGIQLREHKHVPLPFTPTTGTCKPSPASASRKDCCSAIRSKNQCNSAASARRWKHSPELKQRLRDYAHSPPQFLLPLLQGSFCLVNYYFHI
jgi:hypothetical protein